MKEKKMKDFPFRMVAEDTTLSSFVKIRPTVPAAILTNESKNLKCFTTIRKGIDWKENKQDNQK